MKSIPSFEIDMRGVYREVRESAILCSQASLYIQGVMWSRMVAMVTAGEVVLWLETSSIQIDFIPSFPMTRQPTLFRGSSCNYRAGNCKRYFTLSPAYLSWNTKKLARYFPIFNRTSFSNGNVSHHHHHPDNNLTLGQCLQWSPISAAVCQRWPNIGKPTNHLKKLANGWESNVVLPT